MLGQSFEQDLGGLLPGRTRRHYEAARAIIHYLIRIFGLVDQGIEVLVSLLVCEFELVDQDLRVVDPKPAGFGSLPDHFVNQVQLIFGYGWVFIFLHDQLRSWLVLAVIEI